MSINNENTPILKQKKNSKSKKRGVIIKRVPYHYGAHSTAGQVQYPNVSINSMEGRSFNNRTIEVPFDHDDFNDEHPQHAQHPSSSIQSLSDAGHTSEISIQNPQIVKHQDKNQRMINEDSNLSRDRYAASAQWKRYQYYGRLAPGFNSVLRMPDHVVPPTFFYFMPVSTKKGQQSSIVTIFALWNTMMGTSLLSMPWAIQKAGFALGIGLILLVAAIAFYTAYRILCSIKHLPTKNDDLVEFAQVCRHYLGIPGEWASIVFSFVALLGALIVYYVLLVNFSFSTVDYIHSLVWPDHPSHIGPLVPVVHPNHSDVVCYFSSIYPTTNATVIPHLLFTSPTEYENNNGTWYSLLWNQTRTVPLWILLITFPLISVKSPTFFAKFNALGTLSVLYLIGFVIFKAFHWGFHMDFTNEHSEFFVQEARWSFPTLTGIATLAFFIHNCVLTITHSQRHPQNNGRDLLLAYGLVALTYLSVGVTFYISFPFMKSCIADNFLNNISADDELAFVGRIALFFQIISIFPLLMYIMRSQMMFAVFSNIYPSALHVFGFHVFLLTICVLFAMFMPFIGNIIRFSGALSGLVYTFTLPSLVYLRQTAQSGPVSPCNIVLHVILVLLGFANFIAQILLFFL